MQQQAPFSRAQQSFPLVPPLPKKLDGTLSLLPVEVAMAGRQGCSAGDGALSRPSSTSLLANACLVCDPVSVPAPVPVPVTVPRYLIPRGWLFDETGDL
ncbi:hypothetical protein CMUS01_02220 [Colletotrichum musicola]|uniref:Uncharacterized protein n=1 Tax=Colletotrichum musicola TaxID=2175873 RepID=A0A8H6NVF3_9PEZI|nr:hypothetical protein CMUS01_02220 [Colletotrichum musicola]